MKKQIWSLLLLAAIATTTLAFCVTKNTDETPIIGTVENSVFTITYDIGQMKNQWEAVLANGQIEANLSNFDIIFDAENEIFLLRATDVEQNLKCAIALEDSGNGNLIELLTTGGGLTVTCTGCRHACDPKISGERSYCSPACDADDPKGCTKSTTLSQGSGIFLI